MKTIITSLLLLVGIASAQEVIVGDTLPRYAPNQFLASTTNGADSSMVIRPLNRQDFPSSLRDWMQVSTNLLTPWTTVSKTTNQTKTASIVLANDTQLSFSVAAGTKYRIRGTVYFDTTAAGDFKFTFTAPASPTLVRIQHDAIAPAATVMSATAVEGAAAVSVPVLGTGTTGGFVRFDIVLHNGANAGAVTFQWAQNTSDAGNTTVLAGSFLEYMTP